jgi:outer membrane protein, heavy metal efflux system
MNRMNSFPVIRHLTAGTSNIHWLIIIVLTSIDGLYAETVPTSHGVASALDGYLQQALDHNPSIATARASVETKERDIRLAVQLPDPQVSGGYFISSVETRVGPQKGKVGFSQMLPWPGKLTAKRRMAGHASEAAREHLRSVEAGVFSSIRSVYANLYFIGKEIAINRENRKLLQEMESLQLSRYATATVKQTAVLKLQVEIARLDDKFSHLEVTATQVRAALAELLGSESPDSDFPFPENPETHQLAEIIDSLQTLADSLNPLLREADAQVSVARSGQDLARLSFAPDFMIMTDYIITDKAISSMVAPDENGKNPWIVGASLSLPLWFRSKTAQVDKARAREAMSQSQFRRTSAMLDRTITHLSEEYRDVLRGIALHEETLIPKARQIMELTNEAYVNGTATVLDFLDAQRVLLDLDISLVKQQVRKATVTAAIDALLGGELTRKALPHDLPVATGGD